MYLVRVWPEVDPRPRMRVFRSPERRKKRLLLRLERVGREDLRGMEVVRVRVDSTNIYTYIYLYIYIYVHTYI